MEQIERIKQMEQRLEKSATAVMELSAALDKYEAVQEDIEALDAYYGSEDWKQDYADDEAGLLPADLKRGVLSEDGIWNMLSDVRELKNRLYNSHDLHNLCTINGVE
jgi:hypothetical protein